MSEVLELKEMVEMLLGNEGKRKLRLRHKVNEELFGLYDAQLVLRHRSKDALEEAQRVLGHFKGYLGQYPPAPELAAGFLGQFADRKPATLYRYHAIVNGFMTWYGERLESKVKVPETLPDYHEPGEIEKLKQALKGNRTHKGVVERNLLLVEVPVKTGLRRGELANLEVRDINLERGYLVVRQGKELKDRVVDLAPSLIEPLRRYLKGRAPEEKVFNLSPSTLSEIIRRAAKKAGVNLHTHSLRHYFGQSLVDAAVDLEIVRRLMGHTSLAVTQRYLARSDAQRRAAIHKLEKPAAGNPPVPRMKMPVSRYNPEKGEWELVTMDVEAA